MKTEETIIYYVTDKDRFHIIKILEKAFKEVKVYSIKEFEEFLESNITNIDTRNILVIPDVKSGEGHINKVEIPRLCNKYNIKTLIDNYNVLNIIGDKVYFDKLLKANDISTPRNFDEKSDRNIKYIIKPRYAEFSKGITSDSIVDYEKAKSLYNSLKEDYIIQEVI